MVDLQKILASAISNGPQWSTECEDLDVTLLYWKEGDQIAEHVNNEVDVIVIGFSGRGIVTVDGEPNEISPGGLVLIPKGVPRSFAAGEGGFGQLNIHKRRKRLQVQLGSASRPRL